MVWIQSLDEGTLSTIVDISAQQREALLTFGIIGVRIGWCETISSTTPAFPGVATLEEIMGLAAWAQRSYPVSPPSGVIVTALIFVCRSCLQSTLTLAHEWLPAPDSDMLADLHSETNSIEADASMVYRQPLGHSDGFTYLGSMPEPAYRSSDSDDDSEPPELVGYNAATGEYVYY